MAEDLFRRMSDSKNPSYIQLGFGTNDLWGYYVDYETGLQYLRQYIDGRETGAQIQIEEFGEEFEGGNGIKAKIPTGVEDGEFYTIIYYVDMDGVEGRDLGISQVTTDLSLV